MSSINRRVTKLENATAPEDGGGLGECVRRWLALDESDRTPAALDRIEAEVYGAKRPKPAPLPADARARLDEVDAP